MPCVKWEGAEFTGFKVFKWNEYLYGNNLPPEEGLIVFRRDSSHVKRIVRFNLYDMVHPIPDLTTAQYSPRQDGLAFTIALNNSSVFWAMHPLNQLIVNDITAFLLSFFKISEHTVSHPHSPTLVFVLDFSYEPNIFHGCQFSNGPTPTPVCTEPHVFQHQQTLEHVRDQVENNALGMYEEDADRDPDLDLREIDEREDLSTQLRLYFGVNKTYPFIPFSLSDPMGLVEVEAPSVELLDVGVSSADCPICLYGMKFSQSVVKTKCGHMLHKICALPWLAFDVKCPICRSSSFTVL